VFQSAEGDMVCDGGCGAEANPEEVLAMRDAEQPSIERLWNAGEEYGEALRIQVIRRTTAPGPSEPWPLSWPITDIALEGVALEQLTPGMSTRIDEPDEVVPLRAVWDEYMTGVHGENWKSTSGIPFEDPRAPEVQYLVSMRDTLPFEDDRGLVTTCTPQTQLPESSCTIVIE
jgi:hypothetical protein